DAGTRAWRAATSRLIAASISVGEGIDMGNGAAGAGERRPPWSVGAPARVVAGRCGAGAASNRDVSTGGILVVRAAASGAAATASAGSAERTDTAIGTAAAGAPVSAV